MDLWMLHSVQGGLSVQLLAQTVYPLLPLFWKIGKLSWLVIRDFHLVFYLEENATLLWHDTIRMELWIVLLESTGKQQQQFAIWMMLHSQWGFNLMEELY